MFNDAKEATEYFSTNRPPTFHEIRSVVDKLAMEAEFSLADIGGNFG